MIRRCVVCGAEFSAPPSSKKITCSPGCSSKRKSASHLGKRNLWPLEARRRLAHDRRGFGYSPASMRGRAIASALPDSQRGPRNRESKCWILVDPSGNIHHVTGLLDWARKHAEDFDTLRDEEDRERVAHNIRAGFGNIVRSILHQPKHPVYTYKGWSLKGPPMPKEEATK